MIRQIYFKGLKYFTNITARLSVGIYNKIKMKTTIDISFIKIIIKNN